MKAIRPFQEVKRTSARLNAMRERLRIRIALRNAGFDPDNLPANRLTVDYIGGRYPSPTGSCEPYITVELTVDQSYPGEDPSTWNVGV